MENQTRPCDKVAENVIFLLRFQGAGSRDQAANLAKLLHDQGSSQDPVFPVVHGVWEVGRRPIVNGSTIELAEHKKGHPGSLPENADLENGVLIEQGTAHYVEKENGGTLLCVSGRVRYAETEDRSNIAANG